MNLKKLFLAAMGSVMIFSVFTVYAADSGKGKETEFSEETLIYQSDFSSAASAEQLKEWKFESKNGQTAEASIENGNLVWKKTSAAASTFGENMTVKLNLEQTIDDVVKKDFYGKYRMEVILNPQVKKDAILGFLTRKDTSVEKAFSMCLQSGGANIYISSGNYDKVYSGTVWNRKYRYIFNIDTDAGTAKMTVNGSSTDGAGGHSYAYGQNGAFKGLYLSLKDNQAAGEQLMIESVKVYQIEDTQPNTDEMRNALTQIHVPDTAIQDFELPKEMGGKPIAWTSSDNSVISITSSAVAKVNRPYTEDKAVVLTALLTDGIYQMERKFTVQVTYDRELVLPEKVLERCIDSIKNAYYAPKNNLGFYCVTENMSLATSVRDAITGKKCSVSWESTQPEVISNTGRVTMQEQETEVELKAVVTYDETHYQEIILPATVLQKDYEFVPVGTEWVYDFQNENVALERWYAYQDGFTEEMINQVAELDTEKGLVLHGKNDLKNGVTVTATQSYDIKKRCPNGSEEDRLTKTATTCLCGGFDIEAEMAFHLEPDAAAFVQIASTSFQLEVKNNEVFLRSYYITGGEKRIQSLKLYEGADAFHRMKFIYNIDREVMEVYVNDEKITFADADGGEMEAVLENQNGHVGNLILKMQNMKENDQIYLRNYKLRKATSVSSAVSKAEGVLKKYLERQNILDLAENPENVTQPIHAARIDYIPALAFRVQPMAYGKGFQLKDNKTKIIPVPGEEDREFYVNYYATFQGAVAYKYFYFTVKGQKLNYSGSFTNTQTADDILTGSLPKGETPVYAHIIGNVEASSDHNLQVITAQYQDGALTGVQISPFIHTADTAFDQYVPLVPNAGNHVKVMVWDADHQMAPMMEIPMEADMI